MKAPLFYVLLLISLSSCALWPYQSDFDCKIPEGGGCKSLYDVNLEANCGAYTPQKPSCEELLYKGEEKRCLKV